MESAVSVALRSIDQVFLGAGLHQTERPSRDGDGDMVASGVTAMDTAMGLERRHTEAAGVMLHPTDIPSPTRVSPASGILVTPWQPSMLKTALPKNEENKSDRCFQWV